MGTRAPLTGARARPGGGIASRQLDRCPYRDTSGVLPQVCVKHAFHSFTHRLQVEQPRRWERTLQDGFAEWEAVGDDGDDGETAFPAWMFVRLNALGRWIGIAVVMRHHSQKPPHVVVPCGRGEIHGHETKELALACVEQTAAEVRAFLQQLRDTPEARRHRDEKKRRRQAEGINWARVRHEILEEEPLCAICGGPGTQVDHVVPLFRGGTSERSNLRTLCNRCHYAKTRADKGDVSGMELERYWENHVPPSLQDPVNTQSIAARMGVAQRTVQRWWSAGTLPPPDFPGSSPWWEWATIERWARATRHRVPVAWRRSGRVRRGRPAKRSGAGCPLDEPVPTSAPATPPLPEAALTAAPEPLAEAALTPALGPVLGPPLPEHLAEPVPEAALTPALGPLAETAFTAPPEPTLAPAPQPA